MSLLHSIPQDWKDKIRNANKLENVTCNIVDFVKKKKKCCQYFYWKYISMYSEIPEKQQAKWSENLQCCV